MSLFDEVNRGLVAQAQRGFEGLDNLMAERALARRMEQQQAAQRSLAMDEIAAHNAGYSQRQAADIAARRSLAMDELTARHKLNLADQQEQQRLSRLAIGRRYNSKLSETASPTEIEDAIQDGAERNVRHISQRLSELGKELGATAVDPEIKQQFIDASVAGDSSVLKYLDPDTATKLQAEKKLTVKNIRAEFQKLHDVWGQGILGMKRRSEAENALLAAEAAAELKLQSGQLALMAQSPNRAPDYLAKLELYKGLALKLADDIKQLDNPDKVASAFGPLNLSGRTGRTVTPATAGGTPQVPVDSGSVDADLAGYQTVDPAQRLLQDKLSFITTDQGPRNLAGRPTQPSVSAQIVQQGLIPYVSGGVGKQVGQVADAVNLDIVRPATATLRNAVRFLAGPTVGGYVPFSGVLTPEEQARRDTLLNPYRPQADQAIVDYLSGRSPLQPPVQPDASFYFPRPNQPIMPVAPVPDSSLVPVLPRPQLFPNRFSPVAPNPYDYFPR